MIHRRRLALRIYAIGLAQVAALASRVRLARRILEADQGAARFMGQVPVCGAQRRVRCPPFHLE